MIKNYSFDDASNKGVSFTFSRIPGGLCVSGFFNVEKATKIVVPEQVGNLNVIALCESCFSHHIEITEVVLPQKLQYVPEYCF